MNLNPSIYFLCPDMNFPSGGINVIYRIAEVTGQLGYSACVLHEKEGFQNQWSPIVPTIKYWGSGLHLNTGDIVIFPETEPRAMSQLPDRVDKMVLSLSWSLIFENLPEGQRWSDYGIKQVLTNSGIVRDFVQWAIGLPVYRLNVPVDHGSFYYDPEFKEDMMIYMAHRNNQGELIEKIFRQLPRPVPLWKWSAVRDLSHEEYAKLMRRAKIFVTTGLREGMPGPILEAMASGTIVVGYGGVGGNEYMVSQGPDQNAFQVENHDFFSLGLMLEKVIGMIEMNDPIISKVRENALRTVEPLTFEAEKDSLRRFWEMVTGGRKTLRTMNKTDRYKFESFPDRSSIFQCNENPDRPDSHKITPRTKLYITADQKVFTGDEAGRLIQAENDQRYLSEDGVITIDIQRWKAAQEFEKKCQMVQGLNNREDRNIDHQILFNDYKALADQYFEKVIELGCGPFTNIPSILKQVKRPDHISLLDPLINVYLDHPHCVYKNGNLKGIPVSLIDSTIEEFTPAEQYDLVIMVNVLEHCYHVPVILETVTSCLKKTGCLVFADKVFRKEDLPPLLANQYDAGHPIKVSEEFINAFLDHHFQTIYRKEYFGMYDQEHRIDIYFVGTKKEDNDAPELPQMNIKKAKDLFIRGFIGPAKKIYAQILRQDPNSPVCLNDLGFIAFQEGRIQDAMVYFSSALEKNDSFFEAMENMGKCLEYQKNFKEAAKWLKRALEFRPEDVYLLNAIGHCLIQNEDVLAAREIYQRSLHLDDNQTDIKEILNQIEIFVSI